MSRPESIPAMCRRGSSMAEQLGHGVAQRLVALVGAAERDLRHRVVQHPGADRVPLGVVRVEQARRVTSR